MISVRCSLLLGGLALGGLFLGERLCPLKVGDRDPEVRRSIDDKSVLFFVFRRLSSSILLFVRLEVLVVQVQGLVIFNHDVAQVTAHDFTVVAAVVTFSLLFKPF